MTVGLYEFWKRDRVNLQLTLDLLNQCLSDYESSFFTRFVEEELGGEMRKEPEVAMLATRIFLVHNEQKTARSFAISAHALEPENTYLIHNLAVVLFLTGDIEECLELLSTPLKLLEESLILKARCLYLKMELEAALTILKPLDSADALGLASLIQLDCGEMSIANDLAKRATIINKLQYDANLSLAHLCIAKNDIENALPFLEHCNEQQPEEPRLLSLLGQVSFANQDFSQAIDFFLRSTKTQPSHIGTFHLLGWSYLVTEQITSAEQAFNQALTLDRNFAESHGALAVVYVSKGELEAAQNSMTVALKLSPQCSSALFAKSLILTAQGEQEKANKLVDRILSVQHPYVEQSFLDIVKEKLIAK